MEAKTKSRRASAEKSLFFVTTLVNKVFSLILIVFLNCENPTPATSLNSSSGILNSGSAAKIKYFPSFFSFSSMRASLSNSGAMIPSDTISRTTSAVLKSTFRLRAIKSPKDDKGSAPRALIYAVANGESSWFFLQS